MIRQAGSLKRISTKLIDPSPWGIRRKKDPGELGNSMRKLGILSPIRVRPMGRRFQVVFGDRRLAEARNLGVKELDVILQPASDQEALRQHIVENTARKNFNPIEGADGFQRLRKQGDSVQAIAKLVGKSPAHVSNQLALLRLPVSVQQHVIEGKISAGLGFRIAQIVPTDMRENVAETIVKNRFDHSKAVAYLNSLQESFRLNEIAKQLDPQKTKLKTHVTPELLLREKRKAVEQKLMEAFGAAGVNVSKLKFWALLVSMEPQLKKYTVYVGRERLMKALQVDLKSLEALKSRDNAEKPVPVIQSH